MQAYFSPMVDIQTNVPLGRKTFWGIGGAADEQWMFNDIANVPQAWAETKAEKVPCFVLGKGSNTALSDAGFRGRIFHIMDKRTQWISKNVLTVHAGAVMQDIIYDVCRAGWGDWVNLSGIPGVLGGFVRGNAGAFGAETADRLVAVQYCDADGMTHTLRKADGDFRYRWSTFKANPGWLVLSATFQFEDEMNGEIALEKAQELSKKRWAKYPKGRSGGSCFMNPEGDFAGRLLEKSGAKGDRVGGIMISDVHANFCLNMGGGTQADLITLFTKWRRTVHADHGIWLTPEVMLVDEYGQKISLED